MDEFPQCVQCGSKYTYKDQALFICPECGNEWSEEPETTTTVGEPVVKDAHGTILHDGDSVTVIKDIKVKGFTSSLKVGLKVKGIRIVDEVDGHNIDVKVPGIGPIMLKSSIVKKCT